MSISSMESILKRDGITIEYADADEQIVSFKDGIFAVNKEFKVGGDTNLSTNLTVTGPGHFEGTLHVNSSINITKDGLTIKEVTGGNSLIVNGSSRFNNDAHLYNTLITDKKTQLNSTLDVGRSTTMNSTLTVANAATLQNKTTITKATGNALTVDGNSKLFGATTISSFVNVTNFTKLNARLEVNGPSEMNDAVVITKSGTTALTVTGTANLSGVVTLGSSLSVQGAAHLNSSIIVPNATNINNSLTITNAIGNALHVSGQTNLVGAASFGSSISIPNVTTLQSTLSVGKKVVLNDALDVHKAAHFKSSIIVDGLFNPIGGMVMVGENSGLLIRGSTNITGAVVFQSSMEVGGDTYLSSNVSVKGYSHLNSSVVISLDPSLGNALVVNGSTKLNGAVDFQSTLGVSSFVNMFSTVNILGQSNLHHAIDVSREVLMKSSLQVEKMAKLKEGIIVSRVSAGDALSVVGSSNVSSSMNFGSSLNVVGAVQFNSSFQADGPSVLNSSLQITHLSGGNALSVTGSTMINDVVTMTSSLTVFGAAKLNSSLSTIKETTLNNGLVVNGNTLGNTLSVYGSSKFNTSTVIGSNLNVFHETILSTTLNVTGKATIDDDLDVVGAAHLLSTFRVDNIVTLHNMVTMSSLHVSTGTTHFMSSVDVVTSLTANSTVYMSTVSMFNNTGSTLRVAGKSNITNDVTIIGSLTVDGDTTAIQGESIQVKDNAILIGDNHNSDEIASGFLIKYASTNIANNTSTILFAGMKRVPISGEFHFFKNATVELPVSSILTVAPHITDSVMSTQNSYVSSASTVQGSTLTVWGNVINYSSTLSTNYSNVYSTTQSNYISTTQAVLNSTNISYNNAIQYQFTTSTNYINVYSTTQGNYVSTTQGILNSTSNSYSTSIQLVSTNSTIYVNAMSTSHGQYAYPFIAIKNSTLVNWNSSIAGEQDRSTLFVNATSTAHGAYVSTAANLTSTTYTNWNSSIIGRNNLSTFNVNTISTAQGQFVSSALGRFNSTTIVLGNATQLISTNSTIYANAMSTSHGQYSQSYINIKNSTLVNLNSSIVVEQNRSTLFVDATSTAHGVVVSTATNLTSTTYTNWNSSIIGRNNLSTFNVNTISTAQGQFVSSALGRFNSTTVVLGNATQLISTNSTIYVNAMSTSHGQYAQPFITAKNSTLFNWNSSINGRDNLSTVNVNTISTAQGQFVSSALVRLNSTAIVLGNATQLISTNSTIYVNAMSTAHGQYAYPFITIKNSTLFNWNSSIQGRDNLSTVNVNTISTAQGQFVSSALVRLNSTAVVLGNATQLISTNSTIYANEMSTSHGQYAYPFITIKNSTLTNWNSSIQGRNELSTINANTISTVQGRYVSSVSSVYYSSMIGLGNAILLTSTTSTTYNNITSTTHGMRVSTAANLTSTTYTNWMSSISAISTYSTTYVNATSTAHGVYVSTATNLTSTTYTNWMSSITGRNTTSTVNVNAISTAQGQYVQPYINAANNTLANWNSSILGRSTTSTLYVNAMSTAHGQYAQPYINALNNTSTNWKASILAISTTSTLYYVTAVSTAQGQFVQPYITAVTNTLAKWNSSITGRNTTSTLYVTATSTAQGQYIQPYITAVNNTLVNWNSSIAVRSTTSTLFINAASTAHGIAVNTDPNTWAAAELIAKNSTYNNLIAANSTVTSRTATYNTALTNFNTTVTAARTISGGNMSINIPGAARNVTNVSVGKSSSYIVIGYSDGIGRVIAENDNGIRIYTAPVVCGFIMIVYRKVDSNIHIGNLGIAIEVDGSPFVISTYTYGTGLSLAGSVMNSTDFYLTSYPSSTYTGGTWNNSTPVSITNATGGGTAGATAQSQLATASAAKTSAEGIQQTAQTNYNNALATWNDIWNLRDPIMFSSGSSATAYNNWQTAVISASDAEGIYNTAVANLNQAQIDKLYYNPPEMQTAYNNWEQARDVGEPGAKALYEAAVAARNQAQIDKLSYNSPEMQTAKANWEKARDVDEPGAKALYEAAVLEYNNNWGAALLNTRDVAYAAYVASPSNLNAYTTALNNWNALWLFRPLVPDDFTSTTKVSSVDITTPYNNWQTAIGGVQPAKDLYNGINGAYPALIQAENDKTNIQIVNTQEMQTALANWEQARDVGEPAAQALYTDAVNAFNNNTWAGPQLVARNTAYGALMDPANSVTATTAAYDAAVANYNSIVNYHKTVYGGWAEYMLGFERNVTDVTCSISNSFVIAGSRNGEWEVMKEVSNGNQIYTNFFACTYLRIIWQQINVASSKNDIGVTIYVNGSLFPVGATGTSGSFVLSSISAGGFIQSKSGGPSGGFIYYCAQGISAPSSYYSVYVKGGTGAGDLGTAQSQVSTTLANKNASIAAESTLQSNYTAALNAFNAVWLIRAIVPPQFTSTEMTTSYAIWQDAINNGEPGAKALYDNAVYAFNNLFGALQVVARDITYANLQVYNTNLINATNTYNSTLPAGGNRTIYGGYVEYYLGQVAYPYKNRPAYAERYVTNVTVGTTNGQSISNSYVVCGKKNGIWEVLSEYDNSTLTYHNFPNISYSHVRVIFRHINSSPAYSAMNITIYVDGAVFNPFMSVLRDGFDPIYGYYYTDMTQYISNNSIWNHPTVITSDVIRFPLSYTYDFGNNIPLYYTPGGDGPDGNGNGTFRVSLNNAPTGYDPTTSNYTATIMSVPVHGGQIGSTAAYTALQAATSAQQTAQTQYNTALAEWEAIWNQRHTSDLSSGGMATAYAAWQAAIAALNLNPGPYQGYARDSAAWSTVQTDKLLLDPSEMQTSRANWEYARDIGEPAAKAIYEAAFAVYNSIWGAVLLEARNVTYAANVAAPSTATQDAYNTALAEWNALWLPRPLVLTEFTTLSAVSSAAMTTAYDNWEAAKAAWPAIKQNAVDAETAWNSVQDDKVNILIVNTPAMITAKANWEQARDVGEPAAKAIYEAAVIVLNNIWGAVLLEARNVTNAAYIASATGTTLAARNAALAEWNALWLPRPLVPDDFTALSNVASAAMTTAYNNWQAAIAAWPAIKQNAVDAETAWNSVQDDKVNILIVNTPAMIAAKANWEQARDVGEPAAKVIYEAAYAIFAPKWGAIELDARDRTGALAAWNALWLPRPLVPDDFTSLTTVSSAAMTTAYNNWQTAIAARPAIYQNWSDANDALNRVHTDKVNILIVNTPAMIAAKANWEQARDVGEPAANALYAAAVLALSNTWGQSELIARDTAYAGFGYITSLISASAAADTNHTNKVTDYNNKVTAYNTILNTTTPTAFTGGYIEFDLGSNRNITDIVNRIGIVYDTFGWNGSVWRVISQNTWSGRTYFAAGSYSKVRISITTMETRYVANNIATFKIHGSYDNRINILVDGSVYTTPVSVTGSHFTITKGGGVQPDYTFAAATGNGWNSSGIWTNTPAISTSALGGSVWAANVAAAQSQRDTAQTAMNDALTAKNQAKIAMDNGIASLTSTQAAYDAAVAAWNAVWYLRDPTMFSSASMTTTNNNWTIAKNEVIAARAIYDAVYNGKWGIAELEARDVTYAANVAAPSPANLASYTAALAAWNALWLPRPLVPDDFTALSNVASAAMTTAYNNWQTAIAAHPAIYQNWSDANDALNRVHTDKVNILIVNTPAMIAAKANWEQARDVGEPAAQALYTAAVLAFNNTWGAILLVARNTTYAAYVASPSNLSAYTSALADWNALWLPRPIVLSEFTAATMVSSTNMTSTYNNWVQARDVGEPAAKAIYEAAFATYTNTWGAVFLDARDIANAAYVANNLPAKLDAYTNALAAWNGLWLLRPVVLSEFTTLSAVSSAAMTTAYNNWQAAIVARDTLYNGLYADAVLAQNNVQTDKLLYNPAERQTSYAIWQAAIVARDTLRDGLYADAVFAQNNVQIGKLAYNPSERQTSYAIWQAAIVARDTLYNGLYADAVFAQDNVLIGKLAYNPPERQTAYNDWQAAIAAIPVAKGIYDAAVVAFKASEETRRVAIINAKEFDRSLDEQDTERAELRRTTNGVGATVVAASFTYASDARLKKNVVPLNGALDKIDEFDGVYHDWKDEEQPDRAIGVIAQDIQKAYPELVSESSTGFLAVNYPKLTAVLLQSVKELKSMVMEVIERRKAAAQK